MKRDIHRSTQTCTDKRQRTLSGKPGSIAPFSPLLRVLCALCGDPVFGFFS